MNAILKLLQNLSSTVNTIKYTKMISQKNSIFLFLEKMKNLSYRQVQKITSTTDLDFYNLIGRQSCTFCYQLRENYVIFDSKK